MGTIFHIAAFRLRDLRSTALTEAKIPLITLEYLLLTHLSRGSKHNTLLLVST